MACTVCIAMPLSAQLRFCWDLHVFCSAMRSWLNSLTVPCHHVSPVTMVSISLHAVCQMRLLTPCGVLAGVCTPPDAAPAQIWLLCEYLPRGTLKNWLHGRCAARKCNCSCILA